MDDGCGAMSGHKRVVLKLRLGAYTWRLMRDELYVCVEVHERPQLELQRDIDGTLWLVCDGSGFWWTVRTTAFIWMPPPGEPPLKTDVLRLGTKLAWSRQLVTSESDKVAIKWHTCWSDKCPPRSPHIFWVLGLLLDSRPRHDGDNISSRCIVDFYILTGREPDSPPSPPSDTD